MPGPFIGERLKALRAERSWSQTELAEPIGSDARQVSQYENGRITPSLDALVRIAEILDVTLDYLVIDTATRRPLHAGDAGLDDRLAHLDQLTPGDRTALLAVFDALPTKGRLKTLTADIS